MPDQLDTNKPTNPTDAVLPTDQPSDIRVMPERFLARHEAHPASRRHWWVYLLVAIIAVGLVGAGIFLLNRMVRDNNNNNNALGNENTNNAPLNTNNSNVNANVNNANDTANDNDNSNTTTLIATLADTLLRKSDLGEDYANYEESKITTDTTTISNVALNRAQRVFTFEDTKKSSIGITVKVMEAPAQTDANTVWQFENNRLKRLVGNQEGRFVKATTVGDQSLMFEKTDSSQTEAIFSWKYLVADITIDVYKGSAPPNADMKNWLARLLQNFKEYDGTRPVTNTNGNGNTNANTNTNQNTNGTNSAAPPPSSVDQDQDGLTDTEELLYKTGVDKPDTDGDSYLDGPELATGYSPIAASGARLEASGLVKVYTSQTYDYRILYPAAWIVQNAVADGSSVVMTSDTGEFVGITIEENPERLSARQWYLDQSPGIDASKVTDVVVGDLTGVRSSDGLNVYLSQGTVIYIVTYNLASRETANFLTTFDMMIRSFRLTGAALTTNTNTNRNTNTNANANTNAGSNTNTNANSNATSGTSSGPGRSTSTVEPLNTDNGWML